MLNSVALGAVLNTGWDPALSSGYTVWPEILAGNLFWRIGGFESNPPIFHLPKLYSLISLLRNHSFHVYNRPAAGRASVIVGM